MISIYNKLQTYASGHKSGSSKNKNKILFPRKNSNERKKNFNLNDMEQLKKKEYQKSKRKYNSVNVPVNEQSNVGCFKDKTSDRKRLDTDNGSVIEKKLKVVIALCI